MWDSGALGEAIDAGEEAVADFIPEGFDVIHALVGTLAVLVSPCVGHSCGRLMPRSAAWALTAWNGWAELALGHLLLHRDSL